MSLIRGRFEKDADKLVNEYTGSLPFDRRLYKEDIAGSIVHARMLRKQGIISEDEAVKIIAGLYAVSQELEQGKFEFKPEQEDIHMAIEARLTEKIGEVGGKLHTARSRNDQVALDMRLFVRRVTLETIAAINELERAIIEQAEANKDVIMPGYTHLQLAQPVLFAHHILAYFEMLERDASRFKDCLKRTDVMPLGSGALAGVTYNIDREFVAKELGFSQISRNSMDAVSDRDFVIEYEAATSVCMMHLSRLAEEIVIWSSAEFGFVELDDAYATSSSIMPQKKNPDVAEMVRGKTGRVFGNLMAILTTMKGLPLAYDKDVQEDKEGLFDTVDTLIPGLTIFSGLIKTLKINKQNMEKDAGKGYMLATDIADYLVKKGETFRNAHGIVAKLVNYVISQSKTFGELTLGEYHKFSPLFGKDVYNINIMSSLKARNVPGGTAPEQVEKALAEAKKRLEEK
jgi:argininosuccinate lyase